MNLLPSALLSSRCINNCFIAGSHVIITPFFTFTILTINVLFRRSKQDDRDKDTAEIQHRLMYETMMDEL